ncbi:deoxyribose-phosphate aldolase [Tannerella forsythia]|uniref:Deoxyribose-phosphate aldolase n=1 Tax=Tannerella forsythia TaxID=28112 RepID=A0A3P1XGD0_TANFO|nr:deoxyribose-phosphate aldolase [Tannerella forsythia]RRD57168.1 deoxyribose-phosphate aldolase [Tannerella forsythia]RRD72251.1 deoxyribose-phosphate aldolase [Tannerella forsythia]
MEEHEHGHACDHSHADKYHECIARFEPALSADAVADKVNRILEKSYQENFNSQTLKRVYGWIDLTTLTTLDTKETVWQMVEKVNAFEGISPDMSNVAAICTYPVFTATVKQALTAQDVKIAAVSAGFPSSQTFPEVKVAETAMAVMAGADEIDIVMNLGCLMEDAYEEVADEIAEIKDACRDAKLKVILETGALSTPDNIRRATILALYSGADFIKTSTGKGYPGATLEAVYTICRVIKQYHKLSGRKVGVKVSGGIRSAEDAVKYYTIVKELLGDEWLTKEYFRIGASSLVADIEHRLGIASR